MRIMPSLRACGPATIAALILTACQTEVAHDLTEAEANRVAALLSQEGVAAEITAAGAQGEPAFTVAVPSAEGARARLALGRRELPTQPEQGLAEVFDRAGLVPTPTEERARLMRAIQGELAETLESIDGVVAARVHVSLPDAPRGLLPAAGEPAPACASVVLRHTGARPPLDDGQIRAIVAGAVAELRPENVTVVTLAQPAAAAAASAPAVVPLGPFSVSPSSLGPLRAWLAISSAAVGLLGIAIVLLAVRLRSVRKRLADSPTTA